MPPPPPPAAMPPSPPPGVRIDRLADRNHAALLRFLARYPGALFDERPTHLRLWTGLASGFFNAVARAGWGPDSAPMAVRTIAEDLSSRKVPWRWYLGSGGTGEDLVPLLKAVRLMPIPSQTPMALDPQPRLLARMMATVRPVPGLSVVEVRDPETIRDWVLVRAVSGDWMERTAEAWLAMHLSLGLGSGEPLQHLVARRRGLPVASISIFLDEEGTAGIYHVDVVPEARGMGVASWITAAAIGMAADRGAERIVLTSSQAALGLYRRLGFVAQGSFTYFFDPRLGP